MIEPRDAEAASALIQAIGRGSGNQDYPIEILQTLIEHFTAGKVPNKADERHCLVAEENDQLIGTAAVEGAELVTFFVHPDYQHQGVGHELINAIEEGAAARGIIKLAVTSHTVAVPFFERMGYRRIGQIVSLAGKAQIGMEKVLTQNGQATRQDS